MVNALTCIMGQILFILASVACTSHWPPLSPSSPMPILATTDGDSAVILL